MKRTTLLLAATLLAGAAQAGPVVYAQGNFFLNKGKLSGVNYRQGTLLPVGAKVEVLKLADKQVKAKVVDSGAEFVFESHKSLGLNAIDLFKRFFTENDPTPRLAALAPEKQQLIRGADLATGFTRDEVLLSWGPPPPSKTASLEAPKWIYWQSTMGQVEVNFGADGLVTTFGPPEKPEAKPFLGGLFEKKDEPEKPKEWFYAKSNLHSDEGKVSWVNYQHGPLIPFNSKVEVVGKFGETVTFVIDGQTTRYTFENDKRSGKDAWAFFLTLFATEDQAARLDKLTADEKQGVAAAEVQPGFSREAVQLALGPPPPHATASLASSTWTYWKTKLAKQVLVFKGDKLERIQ